MESIHTRVVSELNRRKGTWPQIAEATGVAYNTVRRIANGDTESSRFKTIETLATYLLDDRRIAS